jgi:hypothetical protein
MNQAIVVVEASESLFNLALSQRCYRKAIEALEDCRLFEDDKEMQNCLIEEAKEKKIKAKKCLERVNAEDLKKYGKKQLYPVSRAAHNDFKLYVRIETL